MPLYKSRVDANGGWAVWQVGETAEELRALLPCGGTYLRELASFQGNDKRKMERLVVRVLMYTCWKAEYAVSYNTDGKPCLERAPWRHISISHTQGYVAVCWSQNGEAGIDIERMDAKALRVSARFIDKESEHIEEGHPIESALLYWCGKETLYKMLPLQEATDFVHHLHIRPFRVDAPQGTLEGYDRRWPQRIYHLEYLLDKDFVMTRCRAIQ